MNDTQIIVALIGAIGTLIVALLGLIERRYRNSEKRCDARIAETEKRCDKELSVLKEQCQLYREELRIHEDRLEKYKLLIAEWGWRNRVMEPE